MNKKAANRSKLAYAAIAVVIVVILIMAYLLLNLNAKKVAVSNLSKNDNLSNSTFNRTQLMMLSDLKKSLNISALEVVYSSNYTKSIPESQNLTLIVNSSSTTESYVLGSYRKTLYKNVLSYTNAKTGALISKNTTNIYYYDSNITLTCLNQSVTNSSGGIQSSLNCSRGINGQNYLAAFPFTASNISELGVFVVEGNLTYAGTRSIINRNCDDFIFSNLTQVNRPSSYSVVNLCLDMQDGVPLYANQTEILNGVPSSPATLTATYFSTNVSNSTFMIPNAYLNKAG